MRGNGYLGYKGHVITLPHDVQHIASLLPNLPNELPVVKLEWKHSKEKSRDFIVRRDKVLCALKWLTSHNQFYKDVTIDIERINTLPVDGNIEDRVLKIDTLLEDERVDLGPRNDDEKEKEQVEKKENASFLPSAVSQPREKVRLQQNIQQCEMEIDGDNPFSEYSTPYLASICFPTLFPDGKADPFKNGNRTDL